MSGGCSVTVHSAVSYCVVGENKKTTVDYGTSSIDVEREKICLDSSHYLTRLKIKNISGSFVKLFSAYPVISDDFKIGDIPSSDWQIFNGTRQVNDIPASCVLGVKDTSYEECIDRNTEEGAVIKDPSYGDTVITGDMITVIKCGKQYVSLEVLTNEHVLNDISIISDCKGDVRAVRIGGEFNCLMKNEDIVYTDWVRISTGGNFIRLLDEYTHTRKSMNDEFSLSKTKPAIYRFDNVIESEINEKLAFLKGVKAPFEYLEIGCGWQNKLGDWEAKEGLNLQGLSGLINKSGYKAGIWTAPLLVEKGSELLETSKDWILRHADGSPCTYSVNEDEYYILDISSEDCLEYISMMYQRLSVFGYYLHNVDYLNSFIIQKDVVLLDPTITLVEAYVRLIKAIKSAIGDSGHLYITNGFLSPLTGIADTVQVTSDYDVMCKKASSNVMPKLVNQTAMRGYMSGLWHNACPAFINNSIFEKYSPEEVRVILACEYMNGGMPVVTDITSNDELKILRHIIPAVNIKTNPRDAFDDSAYIKVVDVEVNNDYHTLCFFNNSFSDVELIFRLDNKTCGGYIDHSSKYNISSFFGKVSACGYGYDDIIRMGTISANSCEIVKIAKNNKPGVLFSDMHMSMGGEVEIITNSDNICVKGNNPFNCKGNYTVSVPDGVILPDGKREFSFSLNGSGPFIYKKSIKLSGDKHVS